MVDTSAGAIMDPTRSLDELSQLPGLPPRLSQAEAGSNDLEDHGGDGGMQRGRYRKARRLRRQIVDEFDDFEPTPVGGDQPPSDLEQTLDRMVTTQPDDDTAAYRRQRGMHHYREKDHLTTGYHRRSLATDDLSPSSGSDNKRMGAESATGIDGAEADAVADEFDDFAPLDEGVQDEGDQEDAQDINDAAR